MPSQPDTLQLVPDDQAVSLATQWLERIAERDGWPAKMNFGLTLSLDEALTNIVSYAFAAPSAAHAPAVRLSCHREGNRVQLELADNGRPYDPTSAAPPPLAADLDQAEIGGHGLRLMHHYLDDLRYARDGDWNRLTLIVQG
ncbi:ATP-binding protein [Bordetella sp. BOR01]|uniref:ATP-binding protein n=1 Tax=Bordetella sp. BOR01 TaxID=2854779 RepID=UPI001C45AA78|nr:ATP-binding protein [Bordetella sp. BOR01]MBV7485181.1 ATP-binding protein [Bordetella sp. BOR01]